MSFWTSNTGQWILESIGTILLFLLFWKIFGKRLMTKGQKREREYWKKKFEEEAKEQRAFRAASKPLTQQSFEEWKAAREKAQGRD